jgi:hypothetical protein
MKAASENLGSYVFVGEGDGYMKQLLLVALLGCGTLSAQYARPYHADLFDRVQVDLERAAHDSYPNGKLDHAFKELGEFRARYNAGQSARHELDSAIGALRDLTKSDVLRPVDRDKLQNDLINMRRFREDYRAKVY